jgi:hypothetical protein
MDINKEKILKQKIENIRKEKISTARLWEQINPDEVIESLKRLKAVSNCNDFLSSLPFIFYLDEKDRRNIDIISRIIEKEMSGIVTPPPIDLISLYKEL